MDLLFGLCGGQFRQKLHQAVRQRLVRREKRLRARELAGLTEVIFQHAPAHVTEPGRDRVADERVHAEGVELGQDHAVPIVHVSDEAVPRRDVDFRAVARHRERLTLKRAGQIFAVFRAEAAVSVGVARLPVVARGVGGGEEKVGPFPRLGQRTGRVARPVRVVRNHRLAVRPDRFFDVVVFAAFIVPDPRLETFERHRGDPGHPADRQRLGAGSDPQRVLGREPGDDPPDRVRVRIVVQHAGELVDLAHARLAKLLGPKKEARVVRHQFAHPADERLQRLFIRVQGGDLDAMNVKTLCVFLLQRLDRFFPRGVRESLGRGNDRVNGLLG